MLHVLRIKFMSTSFEVANRWMLQNTFDDKPGNSLVPPGKKPLPEPMLTHISHAIWRH